MTNEQLDALEKRAWLDLVERSDRTSPADYPTMALITEEEPGGVIREATATLRAQLTQKDKEYDLMRDQLTIEKEDLRAQIAETEKAHQEAPDQWDECNKQLWQHKQKLAAEKAWAEKTDCDFVSVCEKTAIARVGIEAERDAAIARAEKAEANLERALEWSEHWQSEAKTGSVGWLYHNPDTGIEFNEQHPIKSGMVPDAERVRPATATELVDELKSSWLIIEQECSAEKASQAEARELRELLADAARVVRIVVEGDEFPAFAQLLARIDAALTEKDTK